MRMKYLVIVLFLCLQSLALTPACRVRVVPFPSLSQLPVSAVHRIFQDSEGYMWYGTVNGLCRDDGYRVRIYRSDINTPGTRSHRLRVNITKPFVLPAANHEKSTLAAPKWRSFATLSYTLPTSCACLSA